MHSSPQIGHCKNKVNDRSINVGDLESDYANVPLGPLQMATVSYQSILVIVEIGEASSLDQT